MKQEAKLTSCLIKENIFAVVWNHYIVYYSILTIDSLTGTSTSRWLAQDMSLT